MSNTAGVTDPAIYQCPHCSHAPYKDFEYFQAHLANKHPDPVEPPTEEEAGDAQEPGEPGLEEAGGPQPEPGLEGDEAAAAEPLLVTRAPVNTLLDEGALRVNIHYDGMNLHILEEQLGEYVRLTSEGPQLKILLGDDFAEGWMPLHDHHQVVVFGEDSHPFTLTPAAARALGLREE